MRGGGIPDQYLVDSRSRRLLKLLMLLKLRGYRGFAVAEPLLKLAEV
jgi:hypothetical protein